MLSQWENGSLYSSWIKNKTKLRSLRDVPMAHSKLEADCEICVSHKAFLFAIPNSCAVRATVTSSISAVPGTTARTRARALTSSFISVADSARPNTRAGETSPNQ